MTYKEVRIAIENGLRTLVRNKVKKFFYTDLLTFSDFPLAYILPPKRRGERDEFSNKAWVITYELFIADKSTSPGAIDKAFNLVDDIADLLDPEETEDAPFGVDGLDVEVLEVEYGTLTFVTPKTEEDILTFGGRILLEAYKQKEEE
jgi:hypothetical protein